MHRLPGGGMPGEGNDLQCNLGTIYAPPCAVQGSDTEEGGTLLPAMSQV